MATLLDAIKGFEGYAPRASWDYKQHSVGYGTRARYPGEVVDRDEADRRLQAEVDSAGRIVDRFAPNLDAGTRGALTSLTYNAGDAWTRSGLGQAIQAGDLDKARASFLQYTNAGGQHLPGLAKRRAAEVAWIGNPNAFAVSQDAEAQPGGFYGAAPSPSSSPMALGAQPSMASYPEPQQQQQPTGFMGLLGALQNGITSPLFQSGAAMYSAASQGKDIGTGFMAGADAAGRASQMQMEQAKNQRELQQQQHRNLLLQQWTNGQRPAWASGLPAGTLELARALELSQPGAGFSMISKLALQQPEKTEAQKNFAYGVANPDFAKREIELKQASRPQTTIDMKGETKFAEEAGKVNAKRLSEYAEAGQSARLAQGDIDRLDELGSAIGTQGAVANVKAMLGPYATALGIKLDGLDDIQAFSAIVSRLAPTMRPPGSGATSDFEFKQFINALPQLAQTTEGRKLVLDQMRSMNGYRAQVGEISERMLSGEIDVKAGNEMIRKLGNPLTLWRQGAKALPPSTAIAPAAGASRFAEPKVSPAGELVNSLRNQVRSGQVQIPQIVEQARRALQQGAPAEAISQRLRDAGIDPASVGL